MRSIPAASGYADQFAMPVLIPESHVPDLGERLRPYCRIAGLADRELIGRFRPLPAEKLPEIIAIRRSCREAGIEKLEAGPKGAVISSVTQETNIQL